MRFFFPGKICRCCGILAVLATWLCGVQARGQAVTSVLQTSGTNIVDGNGAPVLLRGVNLGGWMVMEPWMVPADASGLPDEYSIVSELDNRFGVATEESLINTYRQNWITTQDLNNIAAQGLNVVRVPVWWGDFYTLAGTWRSDAFTLLDWLVNAASARGIYTIIDMHGVFGGQSTSDDTGEENLNLYWTSSADQSMTSQMWSAIAAHYKGNPGVAGYDLINEPAPPNTSAAWDAFKSLYQMVRAADPGHIIIMEGTWGNWDWSMLPAPTFYGWTNVIYEMHEYQYGGTVPAVETGADNQAADYNNHLSWNIPDYIGEFNAFGTGTAAWQYVLNDFNGDNMNWSMWSYKAIHGDEPDSWGLYDPTGTWPATPNVTTDSASTIASDWEAWTTANAFVINPMIQTVIAVAIPGISSASSMRSQGGTAYGISLPLSGNPGVECRAMDETVQLALTFNQAMTSGAAAVTSGTGSVSGALTFNGNTVTVNLTGVTDMQNVTVTLSDLNRTSQTASTTFGLLLGDVNGDGVVNSQDFIGVRSAIGTQAGQGGFNPRADLNGDGVVNSQDFIKVRNHIGDQVPR